MNSQLTAEKLETHAYHDIVIVQYGDENVALECNDCNEVLADADVPADVRAKVNGGK